MINKNRKSTSSYAYISPRSTHAPDARSVHVEENEVPVVRHQHATLGIQSRNPVGVEWPKPSSAAVNGKATRRRAKKRRVSERGRRRQGLQTRFRRGSDEGRGAGVRNLAGELAVVEEAVVSLRPRQVVLNCARARGAQQSSTKIEGERRKVDWCTYIRSMTGVPYTYHVFIAKRYCRILAYGGRGGRVRASSLVQPIAGFGSAACYEETTMHRLYVRG